MTQTVHVFTNPYSSKRTVVAQRMSRILDRVEIHILAIIMLITMPLSLFFGFQWLGSEPGYMIKLIESNSLQASDVFGLLTSGFYNMCIILGNIAPLVCFVFYRHSPIYLPIWLKCILSLLLLSPLYFISSLLSQSWPGFTPTMNYLESMQGNFFCILEYVSELLLMSLVGLGITFCAIRRLVALWRNESVTSVLKLVRSSANGQFQNTDQAVEGVRVATYSGLLKP